MEISNQNVRMIYPTILLVVKFLCVLVFEKEKSFTIAWTTTNIRTARTKPSITLLYERPKGIKAERPNIELQDLTGGRPGSIIETEEELERKEEIFQEIESGVREYPEWINEYGDPDEDVNVQYDTDDPDAIDSSTLGTYDIFDLKSRLEWEWYPEEGDEDPNKLDPELEYYDENNNINPTTGVEERWDPLLGTSNPLDERTIVSPVDSFMIDEDTKDEDMLDPIFPDEDDIEIGYNEDVVKFRKSLRIIETYVDPFIGDEMELPKNVAKWHGYPEMVQYPEKNYTNNRFTPAKDLTNFDAMDNPYRARKRAVELARSNNAEWLPTSKFVNYHKEIRDPYEKHGTLCGTLRKDPAMYDKYEDLIDTIQPALDILGNVVDLLSIENNGKVFRFHYHGLIKNRMGMEAWTKTLLIEKCDVECTGVVFETGFRKRDPLYDGGDYWYKPY